MVLMSIGGGGGSACYDDLGIFVFYYVHNCFGVVVLHRSTVNWRRGMGSVYTGICSFFSMETYAVKGLSTDVWSFG